MQQWKAKSRGLAGPSLREAHKIASCHLRQNTFSLDRGGNGEVVFFQTNEQPVVQAKARKIALMG